MRLSIVLPSIALWAVRGRNGNVRLQVLAKRQDAELTATAANIHDSQMCPASSISPDVVLSSFRPVSGR